MSFVRYMVLATGSITTLFGADPACFGLLTAQKKALFVEHLDILNNISEVRRPFLLCFSGVRGMGITGIAKAVEKKLDGVRIGLEDTRELLKTHGYYDKSGEFKLKSYFSYALLRSAVSVRNGFFILDRSIDSCYELIEKFAKIVGFSLFVVRVEMPREKVEEVVCNEFGEDSTEFKQLEHEFVEYNSLPSSCYSYRLPVTEDNDYEQLIAEISTRVRYRDSFFSSIGMYSSRFRRKLLAYCLLLILH